MVWWVALESSMKLFALKSGSIAGLGCITNLLTAFYDATAKMPTGFWIHHTGNVLLSLQVNEEFLAAFCLFPEFRKRSSLRLRLEL